MALVVTVILALTAFLLYRTAEARRCTGQSRLLASEAQARAAARLDDALLLASVAHGIDPTTEARTALLGLVTWHEKLHRMLHGAQGGVEGLALSADGRLAAGGDSAGRGSLERGRLITSVDAVAPNDIVNAVDFNPEPGELVAGGMSGIVRIFVAETATLRETERWNAAAPVPSVAYSPDGRFLAVGDLLGPCSCSEQRPGIAPHASS